MWITAYLLHEIEIMCVLWFNQNQVKGKRQITQFTECVTPLILVKFDFDTICKQLSPSNGHFASFTPSQKDAILPLLRLDSSQTITNRTLVNSPLSTISISKT